MTTPLEPHILYLIMGAIAVMASVNALLFYRKSTSLKRELVENPQLEPEARSETLQRIRRLNVLAIVFLGEALVVPALLWVLLGPA